MKKFICAILSALILTIGARADEGMWLLPLLEKMNAKAMADLGCRLTPEQIYSINNSSIKDAVVQFGGGCTGEIISDKGLLVTNHHCGYGSIQGLSTPEHNYLEDGYWAMNLSEELPVPGLSVTFLQSMTDVTSIVEKLIEEGPEAAEQGIMKLQEEVENANPNCTAVVQGFYNSNVYYMIVYKKYIDVRFVGAPPASIGKFGGDTDNWMWPRHTGDFSMFRVYAGKDNEPAEYSEENIPYTPKQSLKVSLKGYNDGDFAMIMGYPGTTRRYMTAVQLQDMIEQNDIRVAARTVRQDVLWAEMRADDKVGLQYASKYASSSNGWKKWIGMKESFAKLDIIEREEQKESDFIEWVSKKKKRQEAYGGAIETINEYTLKKSEAQKAYNLVSETINTIELLGLSIAANDSRYKDYSEDVDRKVAVAMINHYLDNVNPEDMIPIPGWNLTKDNVDEYVDYLFRNSVFTSPEKKAAASQAAKDSDPALLLRKAMVELVNSKFAPIIIENETAASVANKAFTAGLLEWKKGEPSYPDANSTTRLTYGTVKSYTPKDGVLYKYYTTLKGVMEKEDPDNYEFRVPAKLKELYENEDYGQYANENGELVTCFLTNNDITGGNSGSPVLDADGNLIGLAFDGNWESMSSDVMFEPELQRCINVDIRYVLFLMDKFGGAGYLLDEMNIVR